MCPHCHSDLSQNSRWLKEEGKAREAEAMAVVLMIMTVFYMIATLRYFDLL